MRAICVIPSRYGSVRLEGKPLIDICGKTLIQRVYESAEAAASFDKVIVATDDERIFRAVKAFGGDAAMTSADLPTGTDRIARVIEDLGLDFDLVMNLQGDEPLIDPKDLRHILECFQDVPSLQMASLMAPLDREEDVLDPNQVKVVVDRENFALYFSRHPIPYWRKRDNSPWGGHPARYWLHMGIYAYTRSTLLQYTNWQRSPLEVSESLEQLRALQNGVRIKMLTTDSPRPGVNTFEDLEKVRQIFFSRGVRGGRIIHQ